MIRFLVVAYTLCVCSSGHADAPASVVQAMTSQQMIAVGRETFVRRCTGCHGENADGKGPAASMLSPKPRNLVSGSFKFRSTPPGVLPTVADLLRTLDQGVPGTSMPSFRDVPNPEKLALVAYVRSLRPEFLETRADQLSLAFNPPPSDIFKKKAGLLSAAARGKAAYAKNCRMCHGDEGRGDGPSAEGMTDSEDQPIRPADLTSRVLKSGPTAGDIFRAITVGLEGAPMPGYGETIKESERWDLTAYVFYLRGRAAGIYGEKDGLK